MYKNLMKKYTVGIFYCRFMLVYYLLLFATISSTKIRFCFCLHKILVNPYFDHIYIRIKMWLTKTKAIKWVYQHSHRFPNINQIVQFPSCSIYMLIENFHKISWIRIKFLFVVNIYYLNEGYEKLFFCYLINHHYFIISNT